MKRYHKHSVEELEKYIQLFLNEGVNYSELQAQYGLRLEKSTFMHKVAKYQTHGLAGIEYKIRNSRYSKEFKHSLVEEYYNRGISIKQLAIKYNIPSHDNVRRWIIKYTKDENNRSYSPRSEVYMMKSRKTTVEERIEIVKDCLTNRLSYRETAQKHQVSYNNVYSWVNKYKIHGPDGLVDGRGRGKPTAIQTDEEKQRAEIAALKARNEYLETENAALKKLPEVERELMSHKHDMKLNSKQFRNYRKKDSK